MATRPLPPHEDEDFTLEVRIPADMDRNAVMDRCIRHALGIEDTFGYTIFTRVKKAGPPFHKPGCEALLEKQFPAQARVPEQHMDASAAVRILRRIALGLRK